LNRGVGSAGVALSSVAPRGVTRSPFSVMRTLWPVLLNPWNQQRTVTLTRRHFCQAFCGAMPQSAADAAYERYAVPAPGRPIFQAAAGHLASGGATRLNFRNPCRAPLLLVAASKDRLVPPAVVRANHAKYARSRAKAEYKEFRHRSHLLIAQEGWQEVAEFALTWARTKTGNADLFKPAPAAHVYRRQDPLQLQPRRRRPATAIIGRPTAASPFEPSTHPTKGTST
jgi:pimeloyl-ACP methyl ester carboxylesterase